MKNMKLHILFSIFLYAGVVSAQPTKTTPPPDVYVPRLEELSLRMFELTAPEFSMDLARLQAELAPVGAELAWGAAQMALVPPGHFLEAQLAPLSYAPLEFGLFEFTPVPEWVEPENPQQDPGYQTYKDGYNLVLQEKWEDARKKLGEIATKYPKSRYVDDAQYWIAYSWITAQPKKAADLYREFFKKYPTSNYFDDAVADLGRLEGQAAADSARAARAEYEARALSRTLVTPRPPRAVESLDSPDPVVWADPTETLLPPGVEQRGEDPDLRIKKDAIEALGRKPDEVAVKTLEEIAMDRSQHRELRQSAMSALRRANSEKALGLYLSLVTTDPDNKIRQDAIYYIGQYARKDNQKAFEVLSQYASDSKQPRELRETAMHALKETRRTEVLNLYLQIAKNDKDTKIKQSALYYIGQLARGNDERAHQVLKEYALDRTQDKEVRETALYSLKELRTGDVLTVYLEVAKNDPDSRIRQSALYYIGQLAKSNDQKAYQVLKDYAMDRQQKVELRETALHSLRQLRRTDVLAILIELAKNDPVEKIRTNAVYQIGKAREYSAEVSKVLMELARDTKQSREVRKTAIYALREFSDIDVHGFYTDLAKNDPDREIQESAIYYIGHGSKDKGKSMELLMQLFDQLPADRDEALKSCLYGIANIGGDKAVDFLIKVAKTHRNYELRQSAVYYLGNIGGEKARSALMEILKGK